MKVEINDLGELCIQGESQLEFYALCQWYKENCRSKMVGNEQANGTPLVINTHVYDDTEPATEGG